MDKMNNSSSSSISIRTIQIPIHTNREIRIIHERIGIMNDTQRARSILWMVSCSLLIGYEIFLCSCLGYWAKWPFASFSCTLISLSSPYYAMDILYSDGFFSFSFHSGPNLIPIRNKVSMCVVTFSMRWFCFLPFYHWSYSYKLLEIWTWGTLLSYVSVNSLGVSAIQWWWSIRRFRFGRGKISVSLERNQAKWQKAKRFNSNDKGKTSPIKTKSTWERDMALERTIIKCPCFVSVNQAHNSVHAFTWCSALARSLSWSRSMDNKNQALCPTILLFFIVCYYTKSLSSAL